MPETTAISQILVLGAGPVATGPACRVLRDAGFRVTVADPNPATITVDAEFADTTYVAPITPAGLAGVIAAERPDGLVVALGGPAAVASALALHEQGVLRRYGTALLGVDPVAWRRIPPVPRVCGRLVDVETLRDRHGRVSVLGTLEHIDDDAIIVPAQVTEAGDRTIRRAATAAVAANAPGAGCCSVRLVADGDSWRVVGVTPGLTRASALAAAVHGLPLAATAVQLAIGADLPTFEPTPGDRVLVALGDHAVGMGTTVLAALNAALRTTGRTCWPAGRTGLPPWLAVRLRELDTLRTRIECAPVLDAAVLRDAKRAGLSDDQIADLRPELADGAGVRRVRERLGLHPHFHGPATVLVAGPPTAGDPPPARRPDEPAVLLLGPAPDDPAEFDHACANGALALRRAGYRVAVVTASIGGVAGIADRCYLLPPRIEDILGAVHAERAIGPFLGVLPQFGGPHALAIAAGLTAAGVDVLGRPARHTETDPVRGRVLRGAVALEVVALYDGAELFLGPVCELIDPCDDDWPTSGCVLPAPSVGPRTLAVLRRRTLNLARRHGVPGMLTIRFAALPDSVLAQSVTTVASTALATASAATGVEFAQAGARLLLGGSIPRLRAEGLLPAAGEPVLDRHVVVRLPAGSGAVLGVGATVGTAFADARAAAGTTLPTGGTVLVSVAERESRGVVAPARELAALGFRVLAGPAIATALRRHGVDCTTVHSVPEADLVITNDGSAALAAQAIATQLLTC